MGYDEHASGPTPLDEDLRLQQQPLAVTSETTTADGRVQDDFSPPGCSSKNPATASSSAAVGHESLHQEYDEEQRRRGQHQYEASLSFARMTSAAAAAAAAATEEEASAISRACPACQAIRTELFANERRIVFVDQDEDPFARTGPLVYKSKCMDCGTQNVIKLECKL